MDLITEGYLYIGIPKDKVVGCYNFFMLLTEKEMERYARQIVLSEIGEEGQKKLSSAKVLVVGAGGLSSAVLMYLAASGVGEIGIIDYDTVDITNLHRQIIYNIDDLGKAKVTSAKEKINKLNPGIKINTYKSKLDRSNTEELINNYEIIVDGLDNFVDKFLLNDYAVSKNKRLVHAGVIGFEGQVLTIIPKESACLRCYFPETPPDFRQNCKELGVFSTCVGVISTIQANEVLKLILEIGSPLTNKILKFNALNSSFYEFGFSGRDKDCPVCS